LNSSKSFLKIAENRHNEYKTKVTLGGPSFW